MKITNFNPDGIPVALGGWSTGITSLNSNIATTDGGISAINFVQRITANGSNILLNPAINFAAGSNIALSSASNTITITGTGTGGGGSSLTVQDEGTPLATAATTLNFVGSGVTASGAGATKTITVAGGSALPWFNVSTYGAVHNNSTDDTAAIQAAIDAAAAAGGGVVYFPAGAYVIGGALQDTGRSNAQLLLPRVDTTGTQITIHLLGEMAPPAIPYISGASVEPTNGPMLRSTLAAGTGAVIGSWGPVGSSDDFSLIRAVVENIEIRTVADPTNSGLDLSHVEAAEVRDVMVDAGEFTMTSISSQTTATSYGLKLPANNNGASTLMDTVNVVGFYNGILAGEHAIGDNVATWAARIGVSFPTGNHASHFDRLGTYHCGRGLAFTGDHYFSIDQWNIEHAPSGTWVPVYDIDDASNHGKGHLAWHVVLGGTGPDHTFTVNGATGVYTVEIGNNPYGGGSSLTVKDEGSSLATAATSLDFVGAGVVASGTGAGKTITIAGASSTSSELVLADGHSTPPVFTDILFLDDNSDFLYSG